MSRFLLGGGKSPGSGNGGGRKKIDAQYLANIRTHGQAKVEETAQDRYKRLMQKKMAEFNDPLLRGTKKSNSFQLPGTKADDNKPKELSKSTRQMLELIAMKKARKEAKKAAAVTGVKAGYFNGGSIDKKGNIYNKANQVVAKIDGKTGKVTSKMGMSIGKYNPKGSLYWLERYVSKYNPQSSIYGPGAQPQGKVNPGSFWGGGSDSGGLYGGGSPWGSSSDDDKGGGWW